MGVTTGEKIGINVITKTIANLEVDIWIKGEAKTSESRIPIVMVHGMFGSGWYFEEWARFLCEKGLIVYVVKDLHHGEDIRGLRFCDYEKKVREFVINEFISNKYTCSRPILLGHSMGGLIAQKVDESCSSFLGLIRGIVLVASAPPRGISTLSFGVAFAMLKHTLSLAFNLPLRLDKRSAYKLILSWQGRNDYKEQVFGKLVPESPRVAKQLAFSRIPIDHEQIACKSLVVAGVYDKLLSLETQIKIAQKYNSDYRSFLAGHMLMLEDDDARIINSIYEWIILNFV